MGKGWDDKGVEEIFNISLSLSLSLMGQGKVMQHLPFVVSDEIVVWRLVPKVRMRSRRELLLGEVGRVPQLTKREGKREKEREKRTPS